MAWKAKGTLEATFSISSGGASAWVPFGPVRGRGAFVIATFTGTTTNTSVKVQGSMVQSTADAFLIAQRKSSQSNAQVASTSGAIAKCIRYVRVFSSGVLSASKTVKVTLAHVGAVSS